ncbi:MAG: hypothetical protein IAE98_13020 [Candidatus Kapabacteria bacterium]|nr:hypothetical protein [Candidatus Kapabacteria bacterium]
MYFVVKYTGQFGFIKPWTAVRDLETFSQQFLTHSIVEGIEKKLFPELLSENGIHKIARHRLSYSGLDFQQEVTWSKGLLKPKSNPYLKNKSIINRGVMLNPTLYLAFVNENDAEVAFSQTVCLARNEDLMFPHTLKEISHEDFDKIDGFELFFATDESGFKVGYNRFDGKGMYGTLKVYGNPVGLSDD